MLRNCRASEHPAHEVVDAIALGAGWSQVAAGVMLSFGGLLSEIVAGGSAGINESNPGLVKFLGGAVFPVGLIMYVPAPDLVLSHPSSGLQKYRAYDPSGMEI